jgi:hypothetical protein
VKGSILSVTVVLAAGLAAAAFAATPERDFRVNPTGGSRVTGTGTLRSAGIETGMQLMLTGLPKKTTFRVVLRTGTCARRSATSTLLGIASAGANGSARYSSLVRRNGAPMRFEAVADGKHVVTIVVKLKTLACGAIPA